jgi:aminoglycoside phosphotransferase family enzyme
VPIGLAEKVAFLRSLCGPGDEAVETHFAWVFLVGGRALKLRKPVRREMMDYASLDARKAGAEAELRLNRRLAPHVYLRTIALTVEGGGQLALGGNGAVADWLVEMQRLDRRWMLDTALDRGDVDDAHLRAVAERLAEFYSAAPAELTRPGELAGRLRDKVAANRAVLETLDAARTARLAAWQTAAIERLTPELDARAAIGCVVEAHGDLRPEHIFLGPPVAIIDCLEFDRGLRILDRAEELALLELECARIGHAAAGRRLREACLATLHDHASPELIEFYRSHRAATRAKLYVWRADEPDGGTPEEWRARARAYLK